MAVTNSLTAAPMASVSKGGTTWTFALDTQGASNSLYLYNSNATTSNGYVARIDPDGSYVTLAGGSIGSGGSSLIGGSLTVLGNASVGGTLAASSETLTGNLTIAPAGTAGNFGSAGALMIESYAGSLHSWSILSDQYQNLNIQFDASTQVALASGGVMTVKTIGAINPYLFLRGGGIGGGIQFTDTAGANTNITLPDSGGITLNRGSLTAGSSTYGPGSANIAGTLSAQGTTLTTLQVSGSASMGAITTSGALNLLGALTVSGGSNTITLLPVGIANTSVHEYGSGILNLVDSHWNGTTAINETSMLQASGGTLAITAPTSISLNAPLMTFLPTAVATASAGYGSIGQFSYQTSVWNGSAGVTHSYQTLSDTGNNLVWQYDGTNKMFLNGPNGNLYLNTGGLSLGTSFYGPTGTTVNGTVTDAYHITNSISGNPEDLLQFSGVNRAVFGVGNGALPQNAYIGTTSGNSGGLNILSNGAFIASISSTGVFTTGSSSYGPTSATVNGTLTVSGNISNTTGQLNLVTDAGAAAVLINYNAGGTAGLGVYNGGTINYGSINSSGFVTGSSTYGPTSTTVNGGLLIANPVSSGATANQMALGTDGAGYAYIRNGGANPLFIQNATGTAPLSINVGAITSNGALTTGSSTYGPTSATVNGTLTVNSSGYFTSPNSGTTGAVIIKDAASNPNAAYLQFVNNGITAQYGYIRGLPTNGLDLNGNAIVSPTGVTSVGYVNSNSNKNANTAGGAPNPYVSWYDDGANGKYGAFLWHNGSAYTTAIFGGGGAGQGTSFVDYPGTWPTAVNGFRRLAEVTNTNAGTFTVYGNGTGYAAAALSVPNGDIYTARNNNTGVIFLGNSGAHYLYFDGSNYQLPQGALVVGNGGITAGGVLSGTGLYVQDTHARVTIGSDGATSNYIESGNPGWTAPADLHLSGYNGSTMSNLFVAATTLQASNDITAAGAVYASNWFRTYGATGWYNQTYSVGWYATEAGYVHAYGNAGVKIDAGNGAALYLTSGTSGIQAGGSMSSYGALTIRGDKNTWSGIQFQDAAANNLGTLMFQTGAGGGQMGFYNAANTNWPFQVSQAGVTTCLSTCTATAFYVASSRALKKNIIPLRFDALKAIAQTKIVHYQYKDGPDQDEKLGFIAEDTPTELVGIEPRFDTNRVLSVALAAIKQLEARLALLENK